MRKLYSILAMALMCIVSSFSAKADVTVTLKVDDATRLTGYYQYTDQTSYSQQQVTLDLTQFTGENGGQFTIPASYGYVYINATEGNCITSAVNETSGSSAYMSGNTQAQFDLYGDGTLSVTSADLESTRTASCTITVDDASKVNVSYYTGTAITLQNGENTVKFNPNAETPLQIASANYGDVLYSVKLNDVEQTGSYGRYQVTVADGDKLNIAANFPEEPSTITFSYGDNEADVLGCLSVKVNGEAVADFDGKTLSVMLGDKVTITGDTGFYNFNSAITVDGSSTYFSGSYEFTATKAEYAIGVNATKYATFSTGITVDTPENVLVYVGNSNNALTFEAGVEQTVELTENGNYINVRPADDCYISSITVNGTEYSTTGYSQTSSTSVRSLKEGDKVVITTGKIVRDKKALILADNVGTDVLPYGYQVARYSDRKTVDLVSGEYVEVNFCDSDNPYGFNFYSPSFSAVYQNDVKVSPQYEGGHNYNLTLADGDVVKVYLTAEPETYAVTFSSTVKAEKITVKKDVNTEVADWAEGFSVLQGTKVSLALAEGTDATVKVNGTAVTADENGNYTFAVTAATAVEIIAAPTANAFAYGLSSELVDGVLKVKFSLNTEAEDVTVVVKDAQGNVVTSADASTEKGEQILDINVADLNGKFTWEVEVAGAEKTAVEEFASYRFYHPRGVDVDNSFESPSFGNVFVTEGMLTTSATYWSGEGGGMGLYIFNPDMTAVKNENTGKYAFTGGWTMNSNAGTKSAADLARVRVAEDGRIFVTRMNDTGDYIMYAESLDDLVANDKFTSLFEGYTFDAETYKYSDADGNFIGAANLGFDVKGAGEDLKLLALSSNVNHWSFVSSGASTDEYALGTAATLPAPTNIAALTGQYTIAPQVTNVEYDDRGGVWYCQYRGTPSDTQPALIYLDANGEQKYFEGDGGLSRGGGGIRVSPDGKKIAIASGSAKNDRHFTIYNLTYGEDGVPVLTAETKIDHGIGTNVYDIAWDIAGNIYICGNSGEYLKGFAIPSTEPAVTKAASKYAFEVWQPAANPFAYALSSEVEESSLNVNYSLNTDAEAVKVIVKNEAGEEVASVAGAVEAGEQTAQISIADLADGKYTWSVEVAGREKTAVEEFHAARYYHPRGVDVDNNMESDNFGNIYVTEGMSTDNTTYYPANNGGTGLFIYTPDMNGVKNEVTGQYAFMGGLTYSFVSYGADLARVRVAEDGRIFVTRCNNAGDYILYAENQADLVANDKFTSLLTGGELADDYTYNTTDGFLAGPNIGFDVKGAGEDLKMMTVTADKGVFNFNAAGSRVDEYTLGTAGVLPAPVQVTALSGYTIAPQVTNVEYDDRGGVWYCQYRGTPSDTQPALIYLDANGEQKYFEGAGGVARGGGGIRISPDGKKIAIASGAAKNDRHFTIYNLTFGEDGVPVLTAETKIEHGIGTNVYDIAWDLAGNIYICGNSGEYFKGFALPRTDAFTTDAASKYAFEIGEGSSAIEVVGEDADAPVEYYNLQGVKVNNPENGVFIKKQGSKATKVIRR